jgi:hypothetical protein
MSAPTRSQRTTVSGTVGTSPITVLASNVAKNFLKVHNPAASGGNSLAYTLDGLTTPVVNGAGNTLYPGGSEICDTHVPTGAVQVIGSASNTPYTIEWA